MQDVNMFHRSQVSSRLPFLMRIQVEEFGEESDIDINTWVKPGTKVRECLPSRSPPFPILYT